MADVSHLGSATLTFCVFVKLGGSLITDKRHRMTPRLFLIRRLAREMRAARDRDPKLSILLGHGSGSYGHWEADRYTTRQGVHTQEQWGGFARVSAAVLQLNRLVVDTFVKEGIPIMSLQPAASLRAEDGKITQMNTANLCSALEHGLVPLVFGDVAFDGKRGGTIVSTEEIFVHLAKTLRPDRVLLLGNAPGVLGGEHGVIPEITPESYDQVRHHVRGSGYTDVTGGMADKVEQMLALVQEIHGARAWILTGREPGNLQLALLRPERTPGTLIHHPAANP
ncbi:MAG: isopentenyl phosphate kinase [Anaerolineae bacterium]